MCGGELRMIKSICRVKLVDVVSTDVLRESIGLVATTEVSSYLAVCRGMVMSSVEIIIRKYVTSQNRRLVGKGKKVSQGNRGKDVQEMI